MKRLLLSVVLILSFITGTNAQKTYALLAGVSSYQNSEINLQYTTVDAKALLKVFQKQDFSTTIITSKYVNCDNLRDKLRKLANKASENDRIIFYFSGHGGPGYLCAYDNNFSYTELVSILSSSKAKEIYCFVDACHSGSAQQAASGDYGWAKGSNITFCMASRADEYSWENAWVGHGFFTKALIKALRGKADENGDRQISVGEMFKYVYNDVQVRSQKGQHPQLIGPKVMYNSILTKW